MMMSIISLFFIILLINMLLFRGEKKRNLFVEKQSFSLKRAIAPLSLCLIYVMFALATSFTFTAELNHNHAHAETSVEHTLNDGHNHSADDGHNHESEITLIDNHYHCTNDHDYCTDDHYHCIDDHDHCDLENSSEHKNNLESDNQNEIIDETSSSNSSETEIKLEDSLIDNILKNEVLENSPILSRPAIPKIYSSKKSNSKSYSSQRVAFATNEKVYGATENTCAHTTMNFVAQKYTELYHYDEYKCASCNHIEHRNTTLHTISSELDHDNYYHWTSNKCTACGYIKDTNKAEHTRVMTYVSNDSSTHDVIVVCSECKVELNRVTQAHTLTNGICDLCDYGCSHTSKSTVYETLNETQHNVVKVCDKCKKRVSVTAQNHTWTGNHCEICDYYCKCPSSSLQTKYSQISGDNNSHYIYTKCSICGTESAKSKQEHTYDSSTGKCTKCSYSCTHPSESSEYIYYSYSQHTIKKTCDLCGYNTDNPRENHNWSSGTCTKCNHTCTHPTKNESFSSNGESGHNFKQTCYYCSTVLINRDDPHTFSSSTGKCTKCDYTCLHNKTQTTSYTSNNDTTHTVVVNCDVCGKQLSSTSENHNYSSSTCTNCSHACGHSNKTTSYTYVSSTQHKIYVYCPDCKTVRRNENISHTTTKQYRLKDNSVHYYDYICSQCHPTFVQNSSQTEAHTWNSGDGKCKVCGGSCTHPTKQYYYVTSGQTTHGYVTQCSVCKKVLNTETQPHNWNGDDKCDNCNQVCDCTNTTTHYIQISGNRTNHKAYWTCDNCDNEGEPYTEAHTISNNVCTLCGYVLCTHPNTKITYEPLSSSDSNYDTKHKVITTCESCGMVTNTTTISHTLSTTTQTDSSYHWTRTTCSTCGYSKDSTKTAHSYSTLVTSNCQTTTTHYDLYKCSCGVTAHKNEASHGSWINTYPTGSSDRTLTQHKIVPKCGTCGYLDTSNATWGNHEWGETGTSEGDDCQICGYSCSCSSKTYGSKFDYTSNGSSGHSYIQEWSCNNCNYTGRSTFTESHTLATGSAGHDSSTHWSSYSYCTLCKYTTKSTSSHSYTTSYEKTSSYYNHNVIKTCSCGYSYTSGTGSHSWGTGSSADDCSLCGFACNCPSDHRTYSDKSNYSSKGSSGHSYSQTWYCGYCDYSSTSTYTESHSGDPCSLCGYASHTHSYDSFDGLGMDSGYHWEIYSCSCGSTTTKNKKAHSFTTVSKGYNSSQHWAAYQSCSSCGYNTQTLSPHSFTYDTDDYNSTQHWDLYTCSCGAEQKKNIASHDFDDYPAGSNSIYHWDAYKNCSTCGYSTRSSVKHTETYHYTKHDSSDHYYTIDCLECGYHIKTATKQSHSLSGGYCSKCGYCAHSSTTKSYEQIYIKAGKANPSQHKVITKCSKCKTTISSTTEPHKFFETIDGALACSCGFTSDRSLSAPRPPIDMNPEPSYNSAKDTTNETEKITPVFYNKNGELLKTTDDDENILSTLSTSDPKNKTTNSLLSSTALIPKSDKEFSPEKRNSSVPNN